MCGPNPDYGRCEDCGTSSTVHFPSCPLAIKKQKDDEEEKKKHLEDIAILNQHARK